MKGIIPLNVMIVPQFAVFLNDEVDPLVVCNNMERAQEYLRHFKKMMYGTNVNLEIRNVTRVESRPRRR